MQIDATQCENSRFFRGFLCPFPSLSPRSRRSFRSLGVNVTAFVHWKILLRALQGELPQDSDLSLLRRWHGDLNSLAAKSYCGRFFLKEHRPVVADAQGDLWELAIPRIAKVTRDRDVIESMKGLLLLAPTKNLDLKNAPKSIHFLIFV
jgi:hypothetical protein